MIYKTRWVNHILDTLDGPGWVNHILDTLDGPGWVIHILDTLDGPSWVNHILDTLDGPVRGKLDWNLCTGSDHGAFELM